MPVKNPVHSQRPLPRGARRLDYMQSMFTQFMQTFQAAQIPSPKLQSVSSQIVTEEGASTFPPPYCYGDQAKVT
jgi:hypothetical protein